MAKMTSHDHTLCGKKPSLLSVGTIYVALKICEQLKNIKLINDGVVGRLLEISDHEEDDILDIS